MAERSDPVAELTAEARERLEAMKSDIEKSEKDLLALEELGIDVTRLREKILWAKKARETILKTL